MTDKEHYETEIDLNARLWNELTTTKTPEPLIEETDEGWTNNSGIGGNGKNYQEQLATGIGKDISKEQEQERWWLTREALWNKINATLPNSYRHSSNPKVSRKVCPLCSAGSKRSKEDKGGLKVEITDKGCRLYCFDCETKGKDTYLTAIETQYNINLRNGKQVKQVKQVPQVSGGTRTSEPMLEPSSEPVDGKLLLTEIYNEFQLYMDLEPEQFLATSVWIFFAYLHNEPWVDISTFLAITSPNKRCGKTTYLDILGAFVLTPIMASNISPAVLYRVIEQKRPTLLIDEADKVFEKDDELRTTINSSYNRRTAIAYRMTGKKMTELGDYSTWSPKVLAKIGPFPDTIQDRSIVLELQRTNRKDLKKWRAKYYDTLKPLRAKLLRWTNDNKLAIETEYDTVQLPDTLNSREQDNWRPLIAILKVIDSTKVDHLLKIAVHLVDQQEEDTPDIRLLRDIKAIFDTLPPTRAGRNDITTTDLTKKLNELEDSGWDEYQKGKPISPAWVGRRVKKYKIKSSPPLGKKSGRGFRRKDFENAWARYLSPLPLLEGAEPAEPEKPTPQNPTINDWVGE